MANMSEDALFKAILKNKPGQVPSKPESRPVQVPPKPQVATPKKESPPQPVEKYVMEEPPVEKKNPPVAKLDLEPVVASINNLNSSVNMVYGIMKTVIAPLLILILVISIAMLVRIR